MSGCGSGELTYEPSVCRSGLETLYLPADQQSLTPGAPNNPATGRGFRLFCHSQYGDRFRCPAPLQWSATAGSFGTYPFNIPSDYARISDYVYWYSGGATAPVTITATIPSFNCGAPSTPYTPPVCTVPAFTTQRIPLPTPVPDPYATTPLPSEWLNVSLRCYNQYGERATCPQAPVWTTSNGTIGAGRHDVDTDTYVRPWTPATVFGPLYLNASVAACGSTSYPYMPPAVCAAVNVTYGTSSGIPDEPLGGGGPFTIDFRRNGLQYFKDVIATDFWAYNWTDEWLTGTYGWKPGRSFIASCKDQYGSSIACTNLTWTADLGTFPGTNPPHRFYTSPYAANQEAMWSSANHSGRTNVSAFATYCGVGNHSFNLHVFNACTLNSTAIEIENDGSASFNATCQDDEGNSLLCPYPLFAHTFPKEVGPVTSTQNWMSFGPAPDYINRSTPSFFGTSVVTLQTNKTDVFSSMVGGGPTFACYSRLTIGNPPTSCTIALSNATPRVGQPVGVYLQCSGPRGPTPCQEFYAYSPPSTTFVKSNKTSGNLTAFNPGPLTLRVRLPFWPGFPSGFTLAPGDGPLAPPLDAPLLPPLNPDAPSMAPSCSATLDVQSGFCDVLPRAQTFSGRTTRFHLLQPNGGLERVANLELERYEFRLRFGSDVFACGQDFDSIRASTGFLAVDSGRFHSTFSQPVQPVTITLKNLPYAQMPHLFVRDDVADSPESVIRQGQNCVSSARCFNLAFNPTAHTLTFQANGFSSYATSEAVNDDPIAGKAMNELKLRCPAGLIVEENTTVSVFFTPNGVPTCVNQGMRIQAIGNNTPQPVTFISCDSQNGQHRFSVDTSEGGSYRVNAEFGKYQSQCVFDVVGRAPTPTPELPVWLALVAASLAFSLARSSKAKATGRKK